ncbi:hypothetical protein [Dyadobacter sp. 676]|uniref:Heme exporter protein C n=1 Tax=Dyadobacter sp. 676 TaxID=3088362 RepID=A0AAU8FMD7_9BACT
MIWLVARDKAATEIRKRRFNFWATNFFLAACLSMLPVTAFAFVMVKMLDHVDQAVIYKTYFYSWLAVAVYFMALRNLPKMNRHALVLSAVLCLGVPIANGMSTGLWMWNTWQQGGLDIFFVDALFLILAGSCAYAYTKVNAEAKPFKILSLQKENGKLLRTGVLKD